MVVQVASPGPIARRHTTSYRVATGVKPSPLQASPPTVWWAKNNPSVPPASPFWKRGSIECRARLTPAALCT
jgi:hypothetical protein